MSGRNPATLDLTDLVCEGSTALHQASPGVGEEGLVPRQTLTRLVVSWQQQVLGAVGVGQVIAVVVGKAAVLESGLLFPPLLLVTSS